MALLEIAGLEVTIASDALPMRAVAGVSLALEPGEVLGIVGESGAGKSMLALSILRLLPQSCRVTAGAIRFEGRDLLALPEEELAAIRGARIAQIFQDPLTSLNPVFTIGSQIGEVLRIHERLSRSQIRDSVLTLLHKVGIPDPERRLSQYPHELSGGMRQRVMIAMALACRPRLLIADEPTTALDVTVQAQILRLLRGLQREYGMASLFITHDLGLVAQFAHRVAVMYAGRILEQGSVAQVLSAPAHPYTQALLRSIPSLNSADARLPVIGGAVPKLSELPAGCHFRPRCAYEQPECAAMPADYRVTATAGHSFACVRSLDARHV
jgi:oligopeptide/dipeptide ABC transporter ATP-binding protein